MSLGWEPSFLSEMIRLFPSFEATATYYQIQSSAMYNVQAGNCPLLIRCLNSEVHRPSVNIRERVKHKTLKYVSN
jgi:hypothetical protein